MNCIQEEVAKWVDKVLPNATKEGIISHLKKEINELSESHSPEEAADCLILLLHHAHMVGYDLLDEASKKLEINKSRSWNKPDKNGVIEHKK